MSSMGFSSGPDIGTVVARIESRVKEKLKNIDIKKHSLKSGSKREYAQALHRQADVLHHRGDYETALVLYNRAMSLCSREINHGVAARRTAAAITSIISPFSASRKSFRGERKKPSELVAISCAETAAKKAQKIIEESDDPITAIDQILKCLDSRKDFLQGGSMPRCHSSLPLRFRSVTSEELSSFASAELKKLGAEFASCNFPNCLQIGSDLLVIVERLVDRHRYEVAARCYLAMTQTSLGRHDRAVDQVTAMIKSAKESGDADLCLQSLISLGRVHLAFAHFDAAAKAWLRLSGYIEHPGAKAWLWHEIGRCYYEMKHYGKALKASYRCLEYADEAKSQKWMQYGNLLCGQALVELGRLGESVSVLREARSLASEAGDNRIHDYVTDLVDRVLETLRVAAFSTDIANGQQKLEWLQNSGIEARKLSCNNFRSNVTSIGSTLESKITKSGGNLMTSLRNSKGKNSRRLTRKSSRRKFMSAVVKNSSSIFPKLDKSQDVTTEGILEKGCNDEVRNLNKSHDEPQESRTGSIWSGAQETSIVKDFSGDEMVFVKQCDHDNEPSNRSGKTYVLHELLSQRERMKDVEPADMENQGNHDICHFHSSSTGLAESSEIDVRHVRKHSNDEKYPGNKDDENCEGIPMTVRATFQDQEIAAAEHSENRCFSLNYRDVFLESRSKVCVSTDRETFTPYVKEHKI